MYVYCNKRNQNSSKNDKKFDLAYVVWKTITRGIYEAIITYELCHEETLMNKLYI
jgi:hypothetical protein